MVSKTYTKEVYYFFPKKIKIRYPIYKNNKSLEERKLNCYFKYAHIRKHKCLKFLLLRICFIKEANSLKSCIKYYELEFWSLKF